MPEQSWAFAEGWSRTAILWVGVLVVAWLVFLVAELRQRRGARLATGLTGVVAGLLVFFAVLRP